MKSHIHYETAFESYLREKQVPYVAVDEAKRAIFRDAKLKSFDFIVYSSHETNWLVDIKGRSWAPGGGRWENWVTQLDLDGLDQWQGVFGAGFRALFVFAYQLALDAPAPADVVYDASRSRYVFAGVPIDQYRQFARVRSPKWGTVNMPTRDFARFVRPIADLL
ncbi:MAG: HYExAFE family protein [Phycisphaerales bacterium]|nr:HYExAFE family protein [Phycisphaerales bacterium]